MKKVNIVMISLAMLASVAMQSCGGKSHQSDRNALEQRLDSLMSAHYADDAPGAALLIAKNGAIIYDSGRGVADMDTKKPIDGNTAFNIASITKQFTVIGALKLCEEGKLSLDDNVAQHFPELESDIIPGRIMTGMHWQA